MNNFKQPNIIVTKVNKIEGQLSKFTNVVNGWQYRWFVLDTSSMVLEYYLLEEKDGKCRGRQEMEGAIVVPSEEDSHTFCINFSSGEVYKVRAAEARERQMWVDKLRASNSMLMVGKGSNRKKRNKRYAKGGRIKN